MIKYTRHQINDKVYDSFDYRKHFVNVDHFHEVSNPK